MFLRNSESNSKLLILERLVFVQSPNFGFCEKARETYVRKTQEMPRKVIKASGIYDRVAARTGNENIFMLAVN